MRRFTAVSYTHLDQNTRSRDYYDVYILTKLQFGNIDLQALEQALAATSQKRGSYEVIADYENIMIAVKDSQVMKEQWQAYQRNFEYAADVDFQDACDTIIPVSYTHLTHHRPLRML